MALKKYASRRCIRIMGDIPFYLSPDSVQMWRQPELFQLDGKGHLAASAGVPPTHFLTRASCGATPSMTGRGTSRGSLTSGSGASSGAPPSMTPCVSTTSGLSTATGPSPLARRMPGRAIGRMDRGWSSSMPCKNPPPTGAHCGGPGGPGARSPAVCPYLRHPRHEGDGVRLRPRGESAYLPHNCQRDSVIYTGTHDTPTFLQWLRETDPDSRLFASRYLRLRQDEGAGLGRDLRRLGRSQPPGYRPLQDVLGLGSDARMNTPALWAARIGAGGSVRRPSTPTSPVSCVRSPAPTAAETAEQPAVPLEGSAGCPVLLDVPPPSRYNNERKREEEDP